MTDISASALLPQPRRRRRVRPTEEEIASLCLEQERERRRESRHDPRLWAVSDAWRGERRDVQRVGAAAASD